MTEIRKDLIEDAAFDSDILTDREDASPEDAYLTFDYSGRFMYGKTCFGIVGGISEYGRFLVQLASTGPEGEDAAHELAQRVSTDSMGLDSIFYFPGVTISED